MLEEVLPMETNHTTVYRQLQQVAERLDMARGTVIKRMQEHGLK